MWRSFLASQPAGLLSRLRRPAAAAANPRVLISLRPYCTTQLLQADADLDDDDGAAAEKRMSSSSSSSSFRGQCFCDPDQLLQPEQRRRRHLYVVLEQMNTGLGLYKLNLDDLDGGDEDALTGAAADTAGRPRMLHRLPDPVLRLGYQSVNPSYAKFEALGSKIVVTCSINKRTLVYDTTTARLDIGPRLPDDVAFNYDTIATGDKLYTIARSGKRMPYLCETRMDWLPPESGGGFDSGDDMKLFSVRGQTQEWTWKSLPWPLPPRDTANYITSYALHPDGRTIFVSSSATFSLEAAGATSSFSLDTESGAWTRHGNWRLPFCGRAHYDGELDAWVGLRGTSGGLLCACDVPTALGGEATQPSWKQQQQACNKKKKKKKKKEKPMTTFMEAPMVASSRRLVHTGRGRFCLVEMAPAPEGTLETGRCRACHYDGFTYVLHATMFRAKHGKNGELVATPCRPGRSYVVPNHISDFHGPPAFWI